MNGRMSPADAVWYLGENPVNPMMISAVLWLDRTLDVDELRARCRRRILDRFPVFRQRIVPSRVPGLLPHWADDPAFDLDRHLEVAELPAPGDHAALEALCSVQRSTPLPRDRPLWHVHVAHGYRGTGTAVHARIHHSMGDGIGLMQLLLGLADEHGDHQMPVADGGLRQVGREVLHQAGRAVEDATHLARHPTHVPGAARTAAAHAHEAVDAARWAARFLLPSLPDDNILIGRPGGTKRMAWDPDGLPLDDVRAVGRSAGATVNDVLLAVLSGAVHRYLAEHDAVVDDLLVMVPVNLRAPDAPPSLGNRIGLLPVLLPVGEPDARARLATVQRRIDVLKASPAPAVSRALLAGTSLLTPPIERAFHRVHQARSTGVVTNVPGPRDPIHVAGARVVGTIGWGGMTAHLNLSASFVSLGGRVFSGFVTDTAITPDPERILRLVADEWAALRTSVAA